MAPIPWLEDCDYDFPDVTTAQTEPDGLLAASEHISPELVSYAYRRGIFPWYSEGQPVLWWSPDPRCVLYPEHFHISRSFRRSLNNNTFEIRTDTCFRDVMLACAAPRKNTENSETSGTWITPAMLDVYCQLHEKGIAHSIEVWQEQRLVGGIYGLIIGDIFFGESMFSKVKDASKFAMYHICTDIKPYIIDAQVYSEHLQSLGAVEIDRDNFITIIKARLSHSLQLG